MRKHIKQYQKLLTKIKLIMDIHPNLIMMKNINLDLV